MRMNRFDLALTWRVTQPLAGMNSQIVCTFISIIGVGLMEMGVWDTHFLEEFVKIKHLGDSTVFKSSFQWRSDSCFAMDDHSK